MMDMSEIGEHLPDPDTPLTLPELDEFIKRGGCNSPSMMDAFRYGWLSDKVKKAFEGMTGGGPSMFQGTPPLPFGALVDAAKKTLPNEDKCQLLSGVVTVQFVRSAFFPELCPGVTKELVLQSSNAFKAGIDAEKRAGELVEI